MSLFSRPAIESFLAAALTPHRSDGIMPPNVFLTRRHPSESR